MSINPKYSIVLRHYNPTIYTTIHTEMLTLYSDSDVRELVTRYVRKAVKTHNSFAIWVNDVHLSVQYHARYGITLSCFDRQKENNYLKMTL